MELAPADVDRYVAAYRAEEPLYPVEQESIESLPDAFRAGEYGPRDAEWVVRWYFRRDQSAYPHEERREIEERFADVDMGKVKAAIADAIEAIDGSSGDPDEPAAHEGALAALTRLPAVDVRVGSAFLTFINPDMYVPIGAREWTAVRQLTSLEGPYPDAPSIEEYGRYLAAVRDLRNRLDRDTRSIYMTIWRF
ncbi:hypothetical protein [Halorubrum sp. DTA98]|uniref:hypothetical protein n=1 Tax=Halorubrum sp. DTA98 TaxID=3402163 RepID=UPI003AAF195B